jgi:hypothetical protein
MGEANEKARLEKEQADEEARMREEQDKLRNENLAAAKNAKKELFKDIDGPKIARRKILLPTKELTETDNKCRLLSLDDLIKIMSDPKADESLKRAALRAMVDI